MQDQTLHGAPRHDVFGFAYRALVFGLAAASRSLTPPETFDAAEVESAFLAEYARRSGPQRRIGGLLALLFWVSFSVVDYINVGPGSGAEGLFAEVLFLRVLGIAAIAAGSLVASGQRFLQNAYSTWVVFVFVSFLYLALLRMVINIDFPYSYVVDYPGLILYLFFVIGLLKIRARSFLLFIIIALPLSAIGLYLANIASTERPAGYASSNKLAMLPSFFAYYYVSSMIYLTSSMIVGYAICCQLERDARAAFHRERELDLSNQTLVEARRDVESKTLALLAAKEELRTSAERANLDKSKFLADAVHDLSQPTQAVSLLAESARLAMTRGDFATASNLIELTGRAAKLARSSFQAVLEISRLESGLIKPILTTFAARDFVLEAIAPLRVIAQANGVKLRVRMPRVDGATAFSDRDLMLRAVANLVSNAVKYSDPEKVERQAVLIGVVALPTRIRIDVIDNGVGIPQSQRGEVFKPFVQLHNPEHNREKGLGLGLSIVNAIFAVLPQHLLYMRSAEGCGTRFSLLLPRHQGAPVSLAEVSPSNSHVADLSSLFVWHVDDDEITRLAIRALLMELGILVEQAASIEELQKELAFTERRPDLVITDYRFPGGRTAEDVIGVFVGRWDRDIPVVVLTGEVLTLGCEAHGGYTMVLKKPAAPGDIIDAINQLCFKNSTGPDVAE